MAGADQHAQPGLANAAADGLGHDVQQHLVEGQLPALVAVRSSQLAVQSAASTRMPAEDSSAPLQNGVPHEDIAVQLPIVVVGSAAVMALAEARVLPICIRNTVMLGRLHLRSLGVRSG